MTRYKVITALITSLLITSCQVQIPSVDIKCKPVSQKDVSQDSLANKRSDIIKLEIQVDGTESMQGFVKNDRKSRYEQTLELLDVIATASWSRDKSTIDYYRFGTKRQGISKQTYINAQKPNFYNVGGVFRDGQIIAAIPPSSANKLSIIVTDLYQTDADISSVIGKLKGEYLQKDYAVGILGIKSEFNGQVYDIGVRKLDRPYNTKGKKTEQFRPFYLIMLGSYQNIVYYFEQLQQESKGLIEPEQFIIFYPRVIESTSAFDLDGFPSKLPQGQNVLRKISTFNNRQVIGKIIDKRSTMALLLQEDAAGNYEINNTISYFPSSYTLQVDSSRSDAFISQISGEIFDQNSQKFQPDNSQGFQFSNWQINKTESEAELTFSTLVDSQKIQSGIYNFTVNLIPNQFKEPQWWQEWNFDESSFDRNNKDNFDGSTTLNLLNFMKGMKSVTSELVETKSPFAASLCYGIQRN
ncbi:MAG: hypothetical protein AAGA80_07945 [Cyanobacteria bacterium P01_F01_bin.143]